MSVRSPRMHSSRISPSRSTSANHTGRHRGWRLMRSTVPPTLASSQALTFRVSSSGSGTWVLLGSCLTVVEGSPRAIAPSRSRAARGERNRTSLDTSPRRIARGLFVAISERIVVRPRPRPMTRVARIDRPPVAPRLRLPFQSSLRVATRETVRGTSRRMTTARIVRRHHGVGQCANEVVHPGVVPSNDPTRLGQPCGDFVAELLKGSSAHSG